jgi:thymidylate synthase
MAALQDATESQIPSSRHEEYQYLDLVREILENGEHRPDRCVPYSREH